MPIKKFLKIETGEEHLVALAFLQAVLIGFPGIFTLTVAHSLFLENYAASNLPYVYLVSSLIIPIAGISYLYFAKKVVFITLQIRILWLISIILLANILLLWWLPNVKWPTFVLLVWFNLEWMLLEFGYWSVANRLFTLRQSKRLFGLIWSGEILTAIIGGLLMSYLVNIMGTVNLLLFSLVGLILALVNLTYMSQVFKSQFAAEEKTTHTEKTSSLFNQFQNSYVLLILAFAIFSVYIVYFFVDNIFYYQLNEYFHDSTQIAIFLGQFWAVYGFLSLFSRAFISGRWITQVGLLGGLLTSPIILGICVISIIIVSQFLNNLVLLFGLIILAKLLEEVLSGAIQAPCYYTLFQAIPKPKRSSVQTSIELILAPMIGIFVAGASLLLLNKYFEFTGLGLSVVLFFILIILASIIWLTIKQYKKALTSNLNLNNLLVRNPLDDLILSDPYTLKILEQGLKSPRSEEVVFCLKSLEEGNYLKIKKILLQMIYHQNPSVRIAVYQTIERFKNKVFYISLKQQLLIEKNTLVEAALLLAIGATGKSDAIACLKTYLNNKRPEILQAVIISMIRYCDNEGFMNAGKILKEFKESTNTNKRVFAAQVLGNMGISNFHLWLLPLLKDKQIKVRKAALIAASRFNNPQLLPLILKNLNNPTLKKEALKVLLNIKEADFPFLDSAYNLSAAPIQVRREIIQVYGRLKSKAAITRLIKQLNHAKRELRHEILTALQLCNYKATQLTEKQLVVEKYIEKEVNYSIQILAILLEQIIKDEFPLLYSALNQELDKTRNNIFLLLSFIYPSDTIKKIAHYWEAKQAQQEMAIELLEHTLNQTHQKLILKVLQKHSLIKKEPLDEIIIQILYHPEHSAWIKSSAIDVALIMLPIGDFQKLIQPFLNDSNEWIRETAHYSLSLITGQNIPKETSLPIIEKVKILRSVDIFSDIPDEMLAEMNTILKEKQIKKGKYIFQQGELGSSMYIIADGLVAIVYNLKILDNLQAGDIFGEMSALVPEKRSSSVMAIQDSHLFQLSKDGLQELMKVHPEVARKIIQFLCHRLGNFKRKKTVNLNKNRNFFDKNTRNFPLSLVEKVILFRNVSIFSQTPYNILAQIAELSTEVVLKKNDLLFKKGEINTNMYIIIDGWVKIYDDDNLIVELGERQTIGELSMFFSEERSFSIAALTNTRLLSLNQNILFDLMLYQHEIVEGIILVLVQRLRYLMKNQPENVL